MKPRIALRGAGSGWKVLLTGLMVLLCLTAWTSPQGATAAGYGPTDFLIADGVNRIAVYDENLVFKSYLDEDLFQAAGLDFLTGGTQHGNLVALGIDQVKQYNPTGAVTSTFSGEQITVFPGEIKYNSSNNRLYVGTFDPALGVQEFDLAGNALRNFNSGPNGSSYTAVAVLPGNILWTGGVPGLVGGTAASIDVFDLDTGLQTGTIPFDNGQQGASAMFYSAATDTVLISDGYAQRIYERNAGTGAFVREFVLPGADLRFFSAGITRGPNGDVYITDVNVVTGLVHRWRADGTFVGTTDISANVEFPINIVWAGNIPAVDDPPVANAGPDQTVIASDPVTPVVIDASGTTNPNNAALNFTFSANGVVLQSGLSSTLTTALPPGVNIITVTVTDPTTGAVSTDTVTVIVARSTDRVSGSGVIVQPSSIFGNRVVSPRASFQIQAGSRTGDNFTGRGESLSFYDGATGLSIRSVGPIFVTRTGTQARLSGEAIVRQLNSRDRPGPGVLRSFVAVVNDLSDHAGGRSGTKDRDGDRSRSQTLDSFSITMPEIEYSIGDVLDSGDIRLRGLNRSAAPF